MRHPTTGLSEDDLSRLTGSSSSTASSRSSSSSSSASSANAADGKDSSADIHPLKEKLSPEKATTYKISNNNNNNNNNNNHNNNKNSHQSLTSPRFTSTYLPEFINPLEWQKSRKRKERFDSTSSASQDRKLQRSNSEELLPVDQSAAGKDSRAAAAAAAASVVTANHSGGGSALKAFATTDVIRRVCSEDFKRSAYEAYDCDLKKESGHGAGGAEGEQQEAVDENDASVANRQRDYHRLQFDDPLPPVCSEKPYISSGPTRDMVRRARTETSPARSHRHSPVRSSGSGNSNGSGSTKHRDSDDSECEHERRRSSERFCKSRVPPGRKAAGITKKSNNCNSVRYLGSKRGDENAYKYDLSSLRYERRGFVSKKVASSSSGSSDHNDNSILEPKSQQQQQQQHQQQKNQVIVSPPSSSCGSNESVATVAALSTSSSHSAGAGAGTGTVSVSSSSSAAACQTQKSAPRAKATSTIPITSAQEALPWDRSVSEDQAPVLSRRYAAVRHHPADSMDTAAKLSKIMPYPQPLHKQTTAAQLLADDMDCMEPLDTFRAFTSLENLRTREVMQQVIPAMMSFQTPEERLKQVNKRLTALKKKLAQMEEAYEVRMGYRPSQAERLNDKYMKNILGELSKLRKERHELKTDPMGAIGMKVNGGMDAAQKLEQMRATLLEIEKSLTDKRRDGKRSTSLEELTADQLVQEKTAVQHGLLYFESMYGRPASKDERDEARPLYERYRQLKRLVSRSVTLSSACAGAPELPTIHEHEAMVFEFTPQQYSPNNSTDTTNSPSDAGAPNALSSDESATTTTTTTTATTSADNRQPASHEGSAPASETNVSALTLEQLWEQLDRTRDEKKLLKRTIREYETMFEELNGRKMLKNDRKTIEETYAQYKEKKAKTRLLQALIKKHISR